MSKNADTANVPPTHPSNDTILYAQNRQPNCISPNLYELNVPDSNALGVLSFCLNWIFCVILNRNYKFCCVKTNSGYENKTYFEIRVSGEPLSMMRGFLVGRLLTDAVMYRTVVRSCCLFLLNGSSVVLSSFFLELRLPFVFCCVGIFFRTMFFRPDRRHSAKCPGFSRFACFLPLTGQSCCLDQLGAPHLMQSSISGGVLLVFCGF